MLLPPALPAENILSLLLVLSLCFLIGLAVWMSRVVMGPHDTAHYPDRPSPNCACPGLHAPLKEESYA